MFPEHADCQAYPHPDLQAPSENRTRIFCMASRWVTTTPWTQNASLPNCQRSKSRAPSRNRTRIASLRRRSLAVRPSVLVFSGTGENRTHIARFKRPMHYLVCHNPMCVLSSLFRVDRRGRNRTFNPRLIRTPLLPLSHAPQVGSEGIEPTPNGLKVRHAACYTTTP